MIRLMGDILRKSCPPPRLPAGLHVGGSTFGRCIWQRRRIRLWSVQANGDFFLSTWDFLSVFFCVVWAAFLLNGHHTELRQALRRMKARCVPAKLELCVAES